MSDTELDISALLNEFSLPNISKENLPVPVEVPKTPAEGSVEEITRRNIERANRLLDRVEQDFNSGADVSAKMIEATSKLIDSVSTASEILSAIEISDKTFEFKEKGLDLRKYEFEAKLAAKQQEKPDAPEQLTQNINFFTGSHEDIMSLIKKAVKVPNHIQQLQEIENDAEFTQDK
jgi:methyl-accepting chemotaxis protein